MLTRSAVACIYAFGAAVATLRRQHIRITRETLREPFSIHAFPACPLVLVLAAGATCFRWRQKGGGAALALVCS